MASLNEVQLSEIALMSIQAAKMADGHVLFLGRPVGDEEGRFKLISTESQGEMFVVGFRLRTKNAAQVMSCVRSLAKQVRSGDLVAERLVPISQIGNMKSVGSFGVFTGNIEEIKDDAVGVFRDLLTVQRPVSFLSKPSEIRMARELAQELFAGVLITPAGEIALRDEDNGDFRPIDPLDASDVAEKLIPHLLSRMKSDDFEVVERDLLGLVGPMVAEEALEEYGHQMTQRTIPGSYEEDNEP